MSEDTKLNDRDKAGSAEHDTEGYHTDAHIHTHGKGHAHTHANTQDVINRISRASGHLESVKKMVESGRDCSEVLVQLAAVRGALDSVSRIILKDHITHCIVDAVEEGDQEALDALNDAIDKII